MLPNRRRIHLRERADAAAFRALRCALRLTAGHSRHCSAAPLRTNTRERPRPVHTPAWCRGCGTNPARDAGGNPKKRSIALGPALALPGGISVPTATPPVCAEAVGQTRRLARSCTKSTTARFWRGSNQSSKAVDCREAALHDLGLETAGARLWLIYKAIPLSDSHDDTQPAAPAGHGTQWRPA